MRKVALFLRNLVLVGLFAFLAIYFLHDQFASDLPVAPPDATLVAISVPPALASDPATPTPSPVPLPTPTPVPTPTPRITAVPTPTPTPAPTAASTRPPRPTAMPGDRGDLVKTIQRQLTKLGYLDDQVDGVYGNKTKQAVLDFQKANGMKATGEVDEDTFTALYASTAVSRPTATPAPKQAVTKSASGYQNQDYRAQASAGTRYVLNTNTGKFHKASCHHVKKIKPSNYREYTGTRDAVIGMGYVPCKVCNP